QPMGRRALAVRFRQPGDGPIEVDGGGQIEMRARGHGIRLGGSNTLPRAARALHEADSGWRAGHAPFLPTIGNEGDEWPGRPARIRPAAGTGRPPAPRQEAADSVTAKTVSPGRLVSAIRPPMRSTASLQNGRPSPVSMVGSSTADRRPLRNFSKIT